MTELDHDPRWQLANRIAASEKLRRSQQLRKLLLFITEHAISHSDGALKEQEIGTEVFDRPTDYNTSEDTIVRVHAFQLRKKLKEYFEGEGAQEPLVIEIPKGSYRPQFRERLADAGGVAEAVSHWSGWRATLLIAAGALVLGAVGGWLGHAWQSRLPSGEADRFWRQAFDNGKATDLVLADASVAVLQDMLGRQIGAPTYQRRQWPELFDQIPDPERRRIGTLAMSYYWTAFTEALAARNLGTRAALNRIPLDVVYARDFSTRRLETGNVILEGNRRANPWIGLFEGRMQFRFEYDLQQGLGGFRNLKPEPGEEALYQVAWNRHGYCRVSYLPSLSGAGTAVVLAGTDVNSAEAGSRFLTSDEWMGKLKDRLGVRRGQPTPYFEALLQTDMLVASSPRFELIAIRRPLK